MSGKIIQTPIPEGGMGWSAIGDEEIEAVTDYIKERETAAYDEEAIKSIEAEVNKANSAGGFEDHDYDELMEEAVRACLNREEGSASLLQRKLRIGFARASRIIDEMEEQGFCGRADGSKPREMLITRDDFERIFG